VAPRPDPARQAQALRRSAILLVFSGLAVGIGMPLLFVALDISIGMTPLGIDAAWLAPLALMIADFVIAMFLWRRAQALERA
jgi:uncharacterized membrane protein